VTFACALDGGSLALCSSPQFYAGLGDRPTRSPSKRRMPPATRGLQRAWAGRWTPWRRRYRSVARGRSVERRDAELRGDGGDGARRLVDGHGRCLRGPRAVRDAAHDGAGHRGLGRGVRCGRLQARPRTYTAQASRATRRGTRARAVRAHSRSTDDPRRRRHRRLRRRRRPDGRAPRPEPGRRRHPARRQRVPLRPAERVHQLLRPTWGRGEGRAPGR